jgi:hypothetical protein
MSTPVILGENRNPQPEMQLPPLLPDQRLRRVLAISRVDGWSVVAIAALSGVISLIQGSWFSAVLAWLVVLAGGTELHGRARLLRGQTSGLSCLIAAQWLLLILIWIYAWWRWRYFDPAAFWAELPRFVQAKLDGDLLAAGLDPALDRPLLLDMVNTLTCLLLAFVSLLFQGGLALYYRVQREAVSQALLASPPPAT